MVFKVRSRLYSTENVYVLFLYNIELLKVNSQNPKTINKTNYHELFKILFIYCFAFSMKYLKMRFL